MLESLRLLLRAYKLSRAASRAPACSSSSGESPGSGAKDFLLERFFFPPRWDFLGFEFPFEEEAGSRMDDAELGASGACLEGEPVDERGAKGLLVGIVVDRGRGEGPRGKEFNQVQRPTRGVNLSTWLSVAYERSEYFVWRGPRAKI